MTGDELVVALYKEQGYLVGGTMGGSLQVGDVYTNGGPFGNLPVSIPLRIVGSATKNEYRRQLHLATRMTGVSYDVRLSRVFNYYRVVAAD